MPPHYFALHDHAKPGLPSERVDRAEACVAYSAEMVPTKNDYHSHGVIAIKVWDDPWCHLTRDDVGEAFGKWLGIPQRDIEVEFFLGKGFLVLMPSPSHRNSILSANISIFIG
jgi:hypothetical protein